MIISAILNKVSKVVFSGIQPTGPLHLGNYFGAVQKWREIQNEDDSQLILSVVDLHAITVDIKPPEELKANILQMGASLLACGIDPKRTILFQQSRVGQHAELSWLFCCMSTVAQMQRLPQYKDKSAQFKKGQIPVASLTYPILQAADILLYKATDVPVGEDQSQHLQVARDLAMNFNNRYDKEYFPIPRQVVTKVPRLRSLRRPEKKMSKSDPDSRGRLEMLDPPDIMRKKIQRAITDFTSQVTYDPENRPGVSNLITIHSAVSGLMPSQICEQYKELNTGQYKMVVADCVMETFEPIRKRYLELMAKPDLVQNEMEYGLENARRIAATNLTEIKEMMGLVM